MSQWAATPNITPRFWVGCAVFLLAISFLLATVIIHIRAVDPATSFAWDKSVFAVLMAGVGARFVLSRGNYAALKSIFS